MATCPHCGRTSPEEAERCEHCGAWFPGGDGASIPPGDHPIEEVQGPAGTSEDQIRNLLAEGRKIEAIKLYREATGAGLKEAKEAIEAMAQGGPVPPGGAEPAVEAEVISLLEQRQKIQAIKLYRERTGTGLKESKDAVETIARRHGLAPQGSGCAGVILLVLVLCGALIIVLGRLA